MHEDHQKDDGPRRPCNVRGVDWGMYLGLVPQEPDCSQQQTT